jgi:molybdate-binding protein/DNA-binding XRE family transcriptional regulator
MTERASNRVREVREARELSQAALAQRALLSRQSVNAIETGRSVPGVDAALRIARALECSVEDLFAEPVAAAQLETESEVAGLSGRAALAHIAERWVSYPLGAGGMHVAADGIVCPPPRGRGRSGKRRQVTVEPLRAVADLRENVVLMGCAAGLGLLADRLNSRPGAGRFLWFSRSSTAALTALGAQQAHLAGVHLVDPRTGEPNITSARKVAKREPISLVTLGRWEAGLLVRADDPRAVKGAAELARPGLRIVCREPGSGSQQLLARTLRAEGLPAALLDDPPWLAAGHMDVARAVAMGAADVGVATRDAAVSLGLGFIPLAEERYDLAVPRSALSDPRLARLFDVVSSAEFRRELSALGYDVSAAGDHAAEVSAT